MSFCLILLQVIGRRCQRTRLLIFLQIWFLLYPRYRTEILWFCVLPGHILVIFRIFFCRLLRHKLEAAVLVKKRKPVGQRLGFSCSQDPSQPLRMSKQPLLVLSSSIQELFEYSVILLKLCNSAANSLEELDAPHYDRLVLIGEREFRLLLVLLDACVNGTILSFKHFIVLQDQDENFPYLIHGLVQLLRPEQEHDDGVDGDALIEVLSQDDANSFLGAFRR